MTQTQQDKDTLAAFATLYPFVDERSLYCLFTGAPVCEIDSYDFNTMLSLLEGTPEERARELATRVLMSSRPSVIWNYVRESDLEILRERRPAEMLAYLRNGARGLDKNKSGFMDMMLTRIEQFQELSALSEDEIESEFETYHRQQAEREAEESKVARRMRAWLEANTATGREVARQRVLERVATAAETMRLRRAAIERKRGVSSAKQKKLAKAKFMDGLINELFAEEDLAAPVDKVLTPAEPAAPRKPAFRIAAFTRKDS